MSNLKEQAMKDIKKRIEMRMCNWCSDSRVCVRERPCGYFSEHAQEWVDLIEQWLKDNNYYPIQADSEGLVDVKTFCQVCCGDSLCTETEALRGCYKGYKPALKAQKALCDKEKEEAVKKGLAIAYNLFDALEDLKDWLHDNPEVKVTVHGFGNQMMMGETYLKTDKAMADFKEYEKQTLEELK